MVEFKGDAAEVSQVLNGLHVLDILPTKIFCNCYIENAERVDFINASFVLERTCHKELMVTEDYTGAEVEYFGCSECGQWLSETDCYGLADGPNYCENCGCKVDSSFVTDENTGEVIYRDGEKVVE